MFDSVIFERPGEPPPLSRAVRAALFGCVLGWVRERSGTLRAPIVNHALNNALATAFILFGYMFR